ncbi:MAG: ABC transporter permease [Bacteroidota bacterium]
MRSYYIKLAFRAILKNRLFSIINVLGLAVGIACFLLVGGYVWQEWRVNKDLRNLDRQYIIQSQWKKPNMGIEYTTIGYLPRALQEHHGHLVENYYRFDAITSNVANGDKIFREGLQIGDSTLLNMYGFSLKYGDEKTALNEPYSLVLTTEKAKQYFGQEAVVGAVLSIENFSGERRNFKVTGVLEKSRQNSITTFSSNNDNHFFIPSNTLAFFGRSIDTWQNIYTLAYLELKEGVDADDLNSPMSQLVAANTPAHIAENLVPYLVPLKDYYLNVGGGAVRKMMTTLSIIAVFILIMAIINFVNIAISKADVRRKEIGVRKVLGSRRVSLMTQFYVEAFLLVSFAALFALGLYVLARPIASGFLSNDIPSLLDFPWYFSLWLLALILLIALLAGTYPALIISGFRPIQALKGQSAKITDKVILRKGLLVFQFAVATVVLVGAIIISQQVNHFFSKDLGYNKDFIIAAPVARDWTPAGVQKIESIRKQFTQLPAVQAVSLSYTIPNGNTAGQQALYKAGSDSTNVIAAESIMVDANYAATYELTLASGDFYAPNYNPTAHELIINEAASKALGWENPEDALQKRLRLVGNSSPFTIKGVLKDFHYSSLHQAIKPAVFPNVSSTNLYRFFSFKLESSRLNQALTDVQQTWMTLMPNTPFDYQFQDEALASLYLREIRLQKAAYAATVLAAIIALLGIFGLLTLNIQKRTREIGIRKVIGANAVHIIVLFLKDFLPILGYASVLAFPLAWYFAKDWLADYTYRIAITGLPFIGTLLILGIATVLLIGIQCFKASRINPVDAIRQG